MLQINFQGVAAHRCIDCQGLFVGAVERERLEKMRGAEAIDIGDEDVGREFNKVDQIDCPRCQSRMIRMVDGDQHHIWFEQCSICGGSFFDAGEFRDLRHHTIVDFFRDLVVAERR